MNVSAGLNKQRWREPKDDIVQIVKPKNVKDIDEVGLFLFLLLHGSSLFTEVDLQYISLWQIIRHRPTCAEQYVCNLLCGCMGV